MLSFDVKSQSSDKHPRCWRYGQPVLHMLADPTALCAGSAETYEEATCSSPAVQEAMNVLNASLRGSEAKAVLFQAPFQRFSDLWASDLPAALQVLAFNH